MLRFEFWPLSHGLTPLPNLSLTLTERLSLCTRDQPQHGCFPSLSLLPATSCGEQLLSTGARGGLGAELELGSGPFREVFKGILVATGQRIKQGRPVGAAGRGAEADGD